MAAGRKSSRCGPYLCLLVFLSSLNSSPATDTLRHGDSLTEGKTLVSAGGVFELGFFSPGDSSKRYVGIWYKNITVRTVVWVANRKEPLTSTSGAVTVGSNGSLWILDGKGTSVTVLWEGSAGKRASNVTLLDSGNLVLRAAGDSQTAWQSFDDLTDTWLPGMSFGHFGRNWQLTSWRSTTDPSPGNFMFDTDGSVLTVRERESSTPVWNSGDLFPPAPIDGWNPWKSYNASVVFRQFLGPEKYDTYVQYRASEPLTRFVMEADGQVRLWTWSSQNWTLLWGEPAVKGGACGVPNYCGPNGLCNNAPTPACECPFGFEPRSGSKWDRGDWSGGCTRKIDVCASAAEGFLPLQGVKQPPVLNSNVVGNSSGCADLCLDDCSCTAYALAHEEISGCFLWFDELTGLQENYAPGGTELYVRLATSELYQRTNTSVDPPIKRPDDRSKRQLQVALPVVLVTIALCGVGLCYFLRRKRQGVDENNGEELLLRDIGMDGAVNYKFVDVSKVGGERGPDICVYSFFNVLEATNNFSDDNKLGQGGFGPVYKGKLPDGQEMAIKRLSARSGQGLLEFKTEILLTAKLQHKNLVRLLGCCIQGEERLIIYEYMPNKSLDFFLFDLERAAQLDWGRRTLIIEGIAQGLLYLHKYSRLTIIHRDLKASNILLDNDMNPKISDFGMARIFSSSEDQANTNRVVGTYGYMSPEYAMEGLFSIKSDVYSFGVLLLEIVSGRKNIGSHHHFPIPRSLLGCAWELWNAGKELELTDPSLGGSWPGQEVSRCIYVGLMCVQECADDRPTMAEVVAMLGNGSSAHQAPKQPAFLTGRPTNPKSCSRTSAPTCYTNEVTISAIEGR